jgi:acyl-CoA thioester hydrolase
VSAPPQGEAAPSGGSDPRQRRSVGAESFDAGPPQVEAAPSGGSDPRERRSVGATFQWPVRIYWEDTDAGGIVFYANYLKFFERARTEWLRGLGLGQQHLRETLGGMFVVTDTQLRYLRPARLDDLLGVTARVRESGRASLTIEQAAWLQPAPGSGEAPHLLCEGTVRIGWVDSQQMRPMRIPADILALLQPHTVTP